MKPGTYYIGDLCYVFTDEEWGEVCELVIVDNKCKEGDFVLKSGKQFSMFNTQYGDGTYDVYQGGFIGQVGVDSGSIGCTLLENCAQMQNAIESSIDDVRVAGKVCEIDHEFYPSNNGEGLLRFGDVRIDTGDEDRWESEDDPACWDEED